MKEKTFVCTVCGCEYPISQREEFDDQGLCPHCLEEETVVCRICGERLWRDDNAGNDDTPLCNRCYDSYYTNCVRCGALLHYDDAYYHRDDPDDEEPLCYTSHQAGTCGLHIHVSRLAFGKDVEQQDACIARVLYFFEKHWEELLKFSRRTPRQLERWAARYGYKDQPGDILEHAKKGYGGGRYSCVNLQNTDTIEFRMFRGTLKYNTLIATLQLVDRICDVAIHLSDDELKAMSWTTFVSGCRATELVQYLKERRIYVNEPVSGEEEL